MLLLLMMMMMKIFDVTPRRRWHLVGASVSLIRYVELAAAPK